MSNEVAFEKTMQYAGCNKIHVYQPALAAIKAPVAFGGGRIWHLLLHSANHDTVSFSP
jgi:hypothetical protein